MRPFRSMIMVILFTLSSGAEALTITTLNLEWFGRGGRKEGTAADEFRGPTVLELIETHLNTTDVFIFQEVVDTAALFTLLPGWDCRTYQISDRNHQYVAACARLGLIARDSTVDSVKVSWGLRPGYRLDLKLSEHKSLSVIGLHLKAGKDETLVRLKQIEGLLKNIEDETPMLLMGDFNTFSKDRTGLEEDDVVLMDRLLVPNNFIQVGGQQATYLGFERRIFDRVWQRNVAVESYEVRGPCQSPSDEPTTRFTLESFYSRFISDHCPVSVKVGE